MYYWLEKNSLYMSRHVVVTLGIPFLHTLLPTHRPIRIHGIRYLYINCEISPANFSRYPQEIGDIVYVFCEITKLL